jgi:hypothetical protein
VNLIVRERLLAIALDTVALVITVAVRRRWGRAE